MKSIVFSSLFYCIIYSPTKLLISSWKPPSLMQKVVKTAQKCTFLMKKQKKLEKNLVEWRKVSTFAHANKERYVLDAKNASIAQLVRAPDC